MEYFFSSYWWLIFPIGFFIFGAWDRWLAYRRAQDRLDLLRSYTNQGKDPPPELLRALQREEDEDDEADLYDHVGRRMRRRYHRRYLRYASPYWAWRTAVVTGAVAAGFWFAAEYADLPGIDWPFRLVAVIMTCVAVGHAIVGLFSTVFRPR